MKRTWVLIVLLVVQLACAMFVVADMLTSVIGMRRAPLSWQLRELLEMGAAIGLLLGVVFGAVALKQAFAARWRAEQSLAQVQMAFRDHLDACFGTWALTPAERDVAMFSIKGLSIQEIAHMRDTSEGTVKAQCNAIYRKAGVTGRGQFMSLFLDDLLDDLLAEDVAVH